MDPLIPFSPGMNLQGRGRNIEKAACEVNPEFTTNPVPSQSRPFAGRGFCESQANCTVYSATVLLIIQRINSIFNFNFRIRTNS